MREATLALSGDTTRDTARDSDRNTPADYPGNHLQYSGRKRCAAVVGIYERFGVGNRDGGTDLANRRHPGELAKLCCLIASARYRI